MAGRELIVMTRDALECPLESSTKQNFLTYDRMWWLPQSQHLGDLKQEDCHEAILGYVLNPRAGWTYRLKSHF